MEFYEQVLQSASTHDRHKDQEKFDLELGQHCPHANVPPDVVFSSPHRCVDLPRRSVSMRSSALVPANVQRLGITNEEEKKDCQEEYTNPSNRPSYCSMSDTERFDELSGGWGGFNRSLTVAAMEPDRLSNEVLSFAMQVCPDYPSECC